ncbi:hypothetical protein T4E_4290, partial [Trichinella pseudospiralis]
LLDNEGLCTILFKIEAYHNARLLTLLEELRDCLILLKPFQLLTSRRRRRPELAPPGAQTQKLEEPVALPAAANRQMVAAL